MKITLIGAGALGGALGAKLGLAGNDVTIIDINEALIRAINEQGGMIYDGPKGTQLAPMKACRYEDFDKIDAELIVLLTKTMHSRSAMEQLKDKICEDSYLMSLQNGLGNLELLMEYAPLEKIIVGTTLEESNPVAPGHIKSTGNGTTSIGAPAGNNDMVVKVNDLFNAAGIICSIADDIMASIWEKVAFNCATNTMASVTRLCDKYTLGTPETMQLGLNIGSEVCDVANRAGIKANKDAVLHKLETMWKLVGDHYPSMAQDVFARRRTEVATINGAVYAKAQELGMQVPYTETMYRLVRCIEQNYENQYSL